jgi:hypothetical protein
MPSHDSLIFGDCGMLWQQAVVDADVVLTARAGDLADQLRVRRVADVVDREAGVVADVRAFAGEGDVGVQTADQWPGHRHAGQMRDVVALRRAGVRWRSGGLASQSGQSKCG